MRRVFVHGFTQTPTSWDLVATRLADAPHIAPDVPVAATWDDAIRALADDGGPGEWVGYSMGGRLALNVALERPDLVERLVLVSASPGIVDDAERAARRASDDALAREAERDGVEAFITRWLAQPLFATLPAGAAGSEDRVRANTVARIASHLRVLGQGAQPSVWGRLGALHVPVLLVAGGLDAKYVDVAARMATAITDATAVVIPGAGHACHLERPDVFAHALTSWESTR